MTELTIAVDVERNATKQANKGSFTLVTIAIQL